jgi:hypothetical protein
MTHLARFFLLLVTAGLSAASSQYAATSWPRAFGGDAQTCREGDLERVWVRSGVSGSTPDGLSGVPGCVASWSLSFLFVCLLCLVLVFFFFFFLLSSLLAMDGWSCFFSFFFSSQLLIFVSVRAPRHGIALFTFFLLLPWGRRGCVSSVCCFWLFWICFLLPFFFLEIFLVFILFYFLTFFSPPPSISRRTLRLFARRRSRRAVPAVDVAREQHSPEASRPGHPTRWADCDAALFSAARGARPARRARQLDLRGDWGHAPRAVAGAPGSSGFGHRRRRCLILGDRQR